MQFSKLVAWLSTAGSSFAASWIVPGAVWKDASGNTIDAHGGMVYQWHKTYYWIGQSASHNQIPYMYKSDDLLNWIPLGAQASIQSMWRPKIAQPNRLFFIYGQVDRLVQPLVSTKIEGGYSTDESVLSLLPHSYNCSANHFRPHNYDCSTSQLQLTQINGSAVRLPPNNYTYSDTGIFQDPDTKIWYLITSADHDTVQINQIKPDGSVGDRKNHLASGPYEAPGMFKVKNIYYLIVSAKTGWTSNPNKLFWANSLEGKWNGPTDIAPQAENTYNSQNSFELTIKGSKATTYIYMGDSWDSKGGPNSTYTWLPMTVDTKKKTVRLQNHAIWKVNTKTGLISVPRTRTRYEVEDASISGSATITTCDSCVSKRRVKLIDSSSIVKFTKIIGTGSPQWISLLYTVSKRGKGDAYVTVNNKTKRTKISDLNSCASYQSIVPIEVLLKKGEDNELSFSVDGKEGFPVYLDGIETFYDA